MVSRMENYLIKNSNNVVNLICTKKIPLNKMFGLSKRFPGIFQSCTGLFYSFCVQAHFKTKNVKSFESEESVDAGPEGEYKIIT